VCGELRAGLSGGPIDEWRRRFRMHLFLAGGRSFAGLAPGRTAARLVLSCLGVDVEGWPRRFASGRAQDGRHVAGKKTADSRQHDARSPWMEKTQRTRENQRREQGRRGGSSGPGRGREGAAGGAHGPMPIHYSRAGRSFSFSFCVCVWQAGKRREHRERREEEEGKREERRGRRDAREEVATRGREGATESVMARWINNE
jgi:hypothetical protein